MQRFSKTRVADDAQKSTVTLNERRRAAPHASALSSLIVDTLMTQDSIGNAIGLTQPHLATLIARIDKPEPEKKLRQEDRPRVTSVGAKLRVLTDITVMKFFEDHAVASLRQSVALVEDDTTAEKIECEINWRIGNATRLFGKFDDPETRNRAGQELVLLHWVEATLARRRSSWPGADKKKCANEAKSAFSACAKLFKDPLISHLFSPLMRLAFSAVVSINEASAEWALRKATGGNLFEKDFLQAQLAAYEDAFVQLMQLDRKTFRPTRALALRACLEMALYLESPSERRYLALFQAHLMEARRAKTAVQWYLDNYIDELEEPFKTLVSSRSDWTDLRNI